MSDTQHDDDFADVDPEAAEEADNLKDLRRVAKESSKNKREAEAARRELALLKAGVDTDSPVGKLFAKSYDGELTVDAVKASWAELAPAPAAEPATEPDAALAEGEAASTQERANLASGATNAQVPDVDPREVAVAAGKRIQQDGGTEADALATHFDVLVDAAIKGDRRVLVPGWGEQNG